MNWRWIVPAVFALAAIEVTVGWMAYSSGTWNLHHTEVLYRWDAVREVCLIFAPIILGGVAVFGGLFFLLLGWAAGGRR
jgi:hypothetical protein